MTNIWIKKIVLKILLKLRSFAIMKYQSHICFRFCLQVFHQAGPSQRVDCFALTGNKRKVSSQGHDAALAVRESKRGSATFQSLTDTLPTELWLLQSARRWCG